jgi:hypothetical protein
MYLVENRFSKTKNLFCKYICDRIILNLAPIPAVAEPPKLLGPHAHVLVSKTLDGYACAPENLKVTKNLHYLYRSDYKSDSKKYTLKCYKLLISLKYMLAQ